MWPFIKFKVCPFPLFHFQISKFMFIWFQFAVFSFKKKSIVRGVSPSGTNFQALVQVHHTYIQHIHTQIALDDPTRLSSAAGLGIWPVLALLR